MALTPAIDKRPHRLLRHIHGQRDMHPHIQDRILGAAGVVERVIPHGMLRIASAACICQRKADGGPSAVLTSRRAGVVQVCEATARFLASQIDVDVRRTVIHGVAVLVVRVQVLVYSAGATLLGIPESNRECAVGVVVEALDSDVAAWATRMS